MTLRLGSMKVIINYNSSNFRENLIEMMSSETMQENKGLVTQSCPTLCNSIDCSSPGSFVHGILQVRRLEWEAMPSLLQGILPTQG